MNSTEIEKLIAEDMLYHYHMNTIYDNLGVPTKYGIDLMDITARLMGIREDKIPDPWVDTYIEFIKKGSEKNKGERINLAKECCERLIELCI